MSAGFASIRADGRPLAAFLGAFVFLIACFPLQSFDVWWHLANGREIVEGRGIPRTNTYSFTHPDYEVVPTHWLFGLGAYLVHGAFGPSGLVAAKALVVTAAFLLVYALARGRGSGALAAVAVVAVAALASRMRMLERPHVFTMLGLAAFALVLHEARTRRRLAWLLPPLAALWANLHGGVLFGVGLVGMEAAGSLFEWAVLRKRSPEASMHLRLARDFGIAAAACAVAAAVAPAGFGVYTYNLWHVGLGDVVQLAELAPPGPLKEPLFYIMLAGGAAGLALDRRRIRPADALVFIAFGALALYAVRSVPNFALLASPMIAPRLGEGWRRLRESGRPGANAFAWEKIGRSVIGPAMIALSVSGYALGGPFATFRPALGMRADYFPERTAEFVKERMPNARLMNDMAAGGFLAWHWHPGRGVFIDSRTNAYPPDLFRLMYGGRRRAAAALRRDLSFAGLQVAGKEAAMQLDSLRRREAEDILRRLSARYSLDGMVLHFYRGYNPFWAAVDPREWACVSAERSAVVLVRTDGQHASLIERFRRSEEIDPREHAALSRHLDNRRTTEDLARAGEAAARALAGMEREGSVPFGLGELAALYARRGTGLRLAGATGAAVSDYRRALALAPDAVQTRLNLAFALLDDGRLAEAETEFARCRAEGGKAERANALFGLAQSAAALGRMEDAAELHRGFLETGEGRPHDRRTSRLYLDRLGL